MMIKKTAALITAAGLLFAACQNSKTENENPVKQAAPAEVPGNDSAAAVQQNKDTAAAIPAGGSTPAGPETGKPGTTTAADQPAVPGKDTASRNIPFTVARNYFVKNTVTTIDNPKLETAGKFNEIFGMARTMGEKGKPTDIDFSKQYVIAVTLPETNLDVSISPVSIRKNARNEITVTYKTVIGQKRTFTISPFLALIVDKKENGKIILKETR